MLRKGPPLYVVLHGGVVGPVLDTFWSSQEGWYQRGGKWPGRLLTPYGGGPGYVRQAPKLLQLRLPATRWRRAHQ